MKALNMETSFIVNLSLQNSRGLNLLMLAVMEGHHQLAQVPAIIIFLIGSFWCQRESM